MQQRNSRGLVCGVCLIFAIAGLAFWALPALAESAAPAVAQAKVTGQLNINTATEQELTMLPGVGKKTAETIVRYRQEHGPFKSVDELQKVSGIGKKTLEKFRGNCAIAGESTLARAKK